MDAKEWAAELLWAIRAQGGQARTFAEADYPLPWGVELRLPTGALIYLQTPVDPSQAHRPPQGPVAPAMEPVELPQEGPTALADVERWLGWCLTASQSTWIESVELFQHRRGRFGIPWGLHVRAHSGARMWIYFRHCTPAGRLPQGMATWRAQASV
jgi:hypothetical protein